MRAPVLVAAREPAGTSRIYVRINTAPGTASEIVTVDEDGDELGCPLRLTQEELQAAGDALLANWQVEVGVRSGPTALQSALHQQGRSAEETLLTFAAAGNHAFRMILEAIDGDFMRTRFLDCVRRHLNPGDDSGPFSVHSKVLFPWRMLFARPGNEESVVLDTGDSSTVDVGGFLGAAGIVDQILTLTRPAGTAQGHVVAIGIHPELFSGSGGRADLEQVFGAQPDLKVRTTTKKRVFLRRITEDDCTLIYLFCHGQFQAGTAGRPLQQLVLSDRLTGYELLRWIDNETHKRGLTTRPVAIINACQGGVFDGGPSLEVARVLQDYGARGVLGPVIDIPAVFAGRFGTDVIGQLLTGSSLAEAVRATTRSHLDKHKNPLGLAYLTLLGARATLGSTVTQRGQHAVHDPINRELAADSAIQAEPRI